MRPFYKFTRNQLEIFHKKSSHLPPHVHSSLECIYVTEGTLEVGVGQELYHMETGDFAVIFPDLVRHYQVFDSRRCRAIYLLAAPPLTGGYLQTLQQHCPVHPVISAGELHPDVVCAMDRLMKNSREEPEETVQQAYVQIILARCLPRLTLIGRESLGTGDMVSNLVAYLAAHFTEEVSLTGMAKDLGYSPYALSRVFSGTFHTNFNQYVNDMRLDYACSLMKYTDQSITEAYENAGFQSQRTFNRAFRDRYGKTPREYRNEYRRIKSEEAEK